MTPLSVPPSHAQPAFAELSDAATGRVTRASSTIKAAGDRPAHPDRLTSVTSTARPRPVLDRLARRGRPGHGAYVVRPGDHLSGIARDHRVSLHSLLKVNALDVTTVIRPGQRLLIPGGSRPARAEVKQARSTAAGVAAVTVVVRPGETLGGIAARARVTQRALLKANRLTMTSIIHPRQVLRIPGQPVRTAPAAPVSPRLSAAAAANLRYLNAHPVPSRSQVRTIIIQAARGHGVDPRLALAIGWQESGWNQRAVSWANAIGVMQCLPSTGRYMSGVVGRPLDLLQTQDSITCGVALLRTLQRAARSESEVIAAYYQGLASVRARGMLEETERYVAAVLAHKSRM